MPSHLQSSSEFPFYNVLKVRWNYRGHPKKIKVFHLIKTLVCTLCFHLLNVAGCINQTIISISKWTFDLNWMYIRHSCDLPMRSFFIRPKRIDNFALLEEDRKHFSVLMKDLIQDFYFSEYYSLAFLENNIWHLGQYHLFDITLINKLFLQHILTIEPPNCFYISISEPLKCIPWNRCS